MNFTSLRTTITRWIQRKTQSMNCGNSREWGYLHVNCVTAVLQRITSLTEKSLGRTSKSSIVATSCWAESAHGLMVFNMSNRTTPSTYNERTFATFTKHFNKRVCYFVNVYWFNKLHMMKCRKSFVEQQDWGWLCSKLLFGNEVSTAAQTYGTSNLHEVKKQCRVYKSFGKKQRLLSTFANVYYF